MAGTTRYLLFLIFLSGQAFSQSDTIGKVRLNRDFLFNEGIYKTFQEFKNDSPSIKSFAIRKPSPYSDPNYVLLSVHCPDSNKLPDTCDVKDVWGYSWRGDIYVYHLFEANYYKLIAIGALCHFVGLSGTFTSLAENQLNDGVETDTDFQQYFFEFETGKITEFNLNNFLAFLSSHDTDLFMQLSQEKKKKKVIFKYLLKYNSRHPVWIDERL